ncbi:MAG TPA: hypothetical protein PLP23_06035 [Panacibacter sp.]|nr:hypothetical protein [Panacibacter sp.]
MDKKPNVKKPSYWTIAKKRIKPTLKNLLGLKAEIYIAILSFLLSIFAIFETISHDKLSVRPELNLLGHFDDHQEILGSELVNNGIGPAKITSEKIYFFGHRVSSMTELADSIINRKMQFWKNKDSRDFSYWDMVGISLPPNKSYFVFSVEKERMESLNSVIECFDKIFIEYEYEDMYHNQFLVHFGKTPTN